MVKLEGVDKGRQGLGWRGFRSSLKGQEEAPVVSGVKGLTGLLDLIGFFQIVYYIGERGDEKIYLF